MSQIRFLGGPWDGMAIPWGGESNLPGQLALTKPPAGIPSQREPLANGGTHLYNLDTDAIGRFYRYVGRTSTEHRRRDP
jgi:hypothetical protein